MSPAARGAPTLSDRLTALARATDLAEGRLDDAAVAAARTVLDRAAERRSLSADHTVVGFFGATGSGKSSLFNAVLGRDVARTAARRPTTAEPLAAVWGEAGSEPLLDWLGVAQRHHAETPLPAPAAGGGRWTRVRERLTGPGAPEQPGGLILLDLPDFDSVSLHHRTIVQRLVGMVDVVVWVVDPQKYADALIHQEFITPLARHGAVTMVVLNQADRLPAAEVPAVLRSLEDLLVQDGLPVTGLSKPVAVSAATGQGVEDLRARIREVADTRAAASARLDADVDDAAARLAEASGEGEPAGITAEAEDRLTDGLERAANTAGIARAAGRSYTLHATAHTGWIATRWLQRFRKDPLRRLNLDRGETVNPEVNRTSLPPMGPAQRAAADAAVRTFAHDAAAGAPEPWTRSLRQAARTHEQHLPDELDQAVARTDFRARRRSWWWLVLDALQWLAMAALVAGLLWLLGLFLLEWFQVPVPPPPVVEGLPLPVPTLLVLAGVVTGLFTALTGRVLAGLGARLRERAVRRRLRASVADAGRRTVVEPVEDELAAHGAFREALGVLGR
ncbi:50S ribosome-binding GTPase [Kocuria sp. LUK]|uniref:GTPase n=1 Tax=Kocuria sp. LUK TaxID=2897828 RepID=UPI001E2B8565|nr:GTPase [Kocuria sp. LUK]MCD1145615.1 50S ribosome-binding GTPase [Kocuria sp. LUK]